MSRCRLAIGVTLVYHKIADVTDISALRQVSFPGTFTMPIYEYHCSSCRSDFELLVRGEEKPRCPQCESEQLEKQFSVPAAHASGLSVLSHTPPAGGCGAPACQRGCQFQ
ncbi:MAG: zinc ribbon domain-containing protein [Pirellulaceae bacterium]